ncbi:MULTISPECIES: SDR family NAD(P)-dependent oxidoreductase [unclassified Oscillibacter]|uniref:SDR family NAD(P)-dependent oxidoreductase n=1 Tax=unclassified Oscillibacter TaxID=2629304 RepID=UPI0025F13D2F|nr:MULTISPECIES: glucose 1-dehydrogenase [unclassified Oscillibacter]
MNVKDKVIAVTGGAGAIGTEQTKLLAENGAEVWVLDLAADRAEALAKELTNAGCRVHGVGMDVASEEAWKAVTERIVEQSGRLDVIVNNAGINIRKTIEEMTKDEWMQMMEVNTASVFLATKYAIPIMRRQGGGVILNTNSICGLIGHMNTPEAYTATKGAVTLLTKSVAARYAKDNIRCNSIHPATIDTPFVAALMADPVKKQARIDEIPLGRLTTPEDVANAVLYLASEEASFLNGVNLPIDGGVTCY